MTHIDAEITSQPELWRKAAELAVTGADALPGRGQRVAVVGCGTSLYMAQTYAALREASGHGETDAFPASELPARRYDAVVALTRSGTTTEVVDLLTRLRGTVPTTVLTADPDTPVMAVADRALVLDFADERSVVQTRSATCALVLLRAHLGLDVDALVADGEAALADELPAGAVERTQFTFLGTGWTAGLANEAALKLREAALAWAESYPGMEYRHGPISVSDERSVVWALGTPPPGLADEVGRTGAMWVESARDPLAEVIRVQRLAVALAVRDGVDPDYPRNLTRSIILTNA
ncbi:SIS domain-containing protein [Haloechinothrix halophila]|uniref:SIS domain-containing protein n=1 Tax=Haloechinothrix halophila TaxID=1069073 RepID=UPI000426090A|nr:sugar isomerase [Haloechinothrix halophila]